VNQFKLSAIAILAFILLRAVPATTQSVALTFDDGPTMDTQAGMSPTERNDAILRQLKEAGVKSILFLTLQDGNQARMKLVRRWGTSGHLVGNHTVNHPSLCNPKVSLSSFEKDLLACDSAIGKLPGYAKLFRFPYLHEGDSASKRDGIRRFLKSVEYYLAPVSIDASDWYYNSRLLDSLKNNPNADLSPYRDAYLAHLWDRASYYDSLSQVVLHRSVRHILLLHHNQINALFLKDVVTMFRDKGWKIISPMEALDDPVYALEPMILPVYGSLIFQLAKAQGINNLPRNGEGDAYEKPLLDKLGL
jgi:peptidoglycan/xylan/chitin deacetylase (PgdA/CDA1 family)